MSLRQAVEVGQTFLRGKESGRGTRTDRQPQTGVWHDGTRTRTRSNIAAGQTHLSLGRPAAQSQQASGSGMLVPCGKGAWGTQIATAPQTSWKQNTVAERNRIKEQSQIVHREK